MENHFKLKLINCTENDLKNVGFDKTYVKKGIEKHRFKTIKIHELTCAQANILKQTAISVGTDCAVHRETITGKIEKSDCILTATHSQLFKIAEKLKFQPLKLSFLADEIRSLLTETPASLIIRNIEFDWGKSPFIMGILNITPDSFSDGGKYSTLETALEHYRKLVKSGADIIDIGGESTRPFAQRVTVEQEIERVIPVIKQIRELDSKTVISIDTRNAETAKTAIEAGADLINDISSGDWDSEMFNIVKEKGCPIILNHSKGSPDVMQNDTDYNDVVDDIFDYFCGKIKELMELGVEKSKIIIDPGIGFGKTTKQNFALIERIKEFRSLNCPILVGHSRKTFIKETICTELTDELDCATLILSGTLVQNGVNILRVHDVDKHKMLLKLNNQFKK